MTPNRSHPIPSDTLQELVGGMDIYLIDQILRGRIRSGLHLLDAGCGGGRNLRYPVLAGCRIAAVDRDRSRVEEAYTFARQLDPAVSRDTFRTEDVSALSFGSDTFDVVLSNAVLHFADDDAAFHEMVQELWRVLRPGGMLFARLASSIGIEDRIALLAGRRYHLPDGTDRFLVDERFLLNTTTSLGGELLDPIKTVNVQGQRCMTTWCIAKAA